MENGEGRRICAVTVQSHPSLRKYLSERRSILTQRRSFSPLHSPFSLLNKASMTLPSLVVNVQFYDFIQKFNCFRCFIQS